MKKPSLARRRAVKETCKKLANVCRYLRDPTFNRFSRSANCDGRTDRLTNRNTITANTRANYRLAGKKQYQGDNGKSRVNTCRTRSTETVHASAKARLTSFSIRFRIMIATKI